MIRNRKEGRRSITHCITSLTEKALQLVGIEPTTYLDHEACALPLWYTRTIEVTLTTFSIEKKHWDSNLGHQVLKDECKPLISRILRIILMQVVNYRSIFFIEFAPIRSDETKQNFRRVSKSILL